MADPKTRPTHASVEDFIKSIDDPDVQKDSHTIVKMMSDATGEKPVMWGTTIVGFGKQKLKYSSGKELDWPIIGFSPRKQNLTLYVLDGKDTYDLLLDKLGKHTTSKVCLYIKRLSDVDMTVLKELIRIAAQDHKKKS